MVFLELAAGDVALLHNHLLLHASDVNRSDTSRRAFSVCYMDARTVTANGATFIRLWEPAGNLTTADGISQAAASRPPGKS